MSAGVTVLAVIGGIVGTGIALFVVGGLIWWWVTKDSPGGNPFL